MVLWMLPTHNVEKGEILCHWKKISSNQPFSNFFSKTIAITKSLRKKCERISAFSTLCTSWNCMDIAHFSLHSVIVSQNFPQINFAKFCEKFREIDPLKESTNKQLLVGRNFSAFRSASRNRAPNVLSSIHMMLENYYTRYPWRQVAFRRYRPSKMANFYLRYWFLEVIFDMIKILISKLRQ